MQLSNCSALCLPADQKMWVWREMSPTKSSFLRIEGKNAKVIFWFIFGFYFLSFSCSSPFSASSICSSCYSLSAPCLYTSHLFLLLLLLLPLLPPSSNLILPAVLLFLSSVIPLFMSHLHLLYKRSSLSFSSIYFWSFFSFAYTSLFSLPFFCCLFPLCNLSFSAYPTFSNLLLLFPSPPPHTISLFFLLPFLQFRFSFFPSLSNSFFSSSWLFSSTSLSLLHFILPSWSLSFCPYSALSKLSKLSPLSSRIFLYSFFLLFTSFYSITLDTKWRTSHFLWPQRLSNSSACVWFCRYVRVVVLPCVEAIRCLFRTRGSLPQDAVEVNEVFGMQISHSALRQKTLRVDICNTRKSGHEECLVGRSLPSGFANWVYRIILSKRMCKKSLFKLVIVLK